MLLAVHAAGRLRFFADHRASALEAALSAYLEPLRKAEWVVYGGRSAGPASCSPTRAALHLHRVAISNHRLVEADQARHLQIQGLPHRRTWPIQDHDAAHPRVHPPLPMHVLPKSFHRIRHYGLFANGNRAANLARARELLHVAPPATASETVETADAGEPRAEPRPCPRCGGRMLVIEIFARGCEPKHPPQRAPPLGLSAIS